MTTQKCGRITNRVPVWDSDNEGQEQRKVLDPAHAVEIFQPALHLRLFEVPAQRMSGAVGGRA